MNYLRPELLEQLAGAYVLGTLRGPARRRFERLCRQSAVAQRAVQDWEASLTQLAGTVPAVQPSPKLWSRIAGQLGHVEVKPSIWRFLSPALSFAFGLVMAVGVLHFYPGLLPQEDAPPVSANTGLPASYVGLLLDAEGKPTILASAQRHGAELSFKLLQPVEVPQDKVAVVWALPKSGGAANRLGVLPREGRRMLKMTGTAEQLLSATVKIGVSFEDPANIPAAPNNYVFIGHCVKLW